MKGIEKIRRALVGGHPVLYIQTWEEGRVERVVAHLAKTFYKQPSTYGVWTIVDGLQEDGRPVPETRDPLHALSAIMAGKGPGFYLLKDFPAVMDGRPEVTRRLRDTYRALKDKGRFVFLVSPRIVIPEDAKKEIFYIDFELPDEAEIGKILEATFKARPSNTPMSDADTKKLSLALKGLTADEIGHLLQKVFATRTAFDDSALNEVLAEKEQMSKKDGILEFVPPRFTIDDLGGYQNLKDWLDPRASRCSAGKRWRRAFRSRREFF